MCESLIEIACLDGCCEEFVMETTGMGNFHQGDRYGRYRKYLETADGKWVYQQVAGNNFLYYIVNGGYWMVGEDLGVDMGGVLNRGNGQCPESKSKTVMQQPKQIFGFCRSRIDVD